MRREGRGLLLAGPQDMESSFTEAVDFDGQQWAAARSLHRVPILKHARIARGMAGLYDISPDHHAIMGEFPEVEGFICANGFSGHGFQHSPAVGILISELIADGLAKTVDIYPLRPQRFREGDLIYEPLTAFRDPYHWSRREEDMSVVVSFSIFPMDKGESVSPYVARVVRIIRDSGLMHSLGPMGTSIEGEWDQIMALVTQCLKELEKDCNRVYMFMTADYRKGPAGRIKGKVKAVEGRLTSE
jgi:uncharacterized protein (TIGR00106 family)